MSTAPLVVLTGPNGFLGVHVLEALLKAGYRVRGIVRSLDKAGFLNSAFNDHVTSGDLTFVVVNHIENDVLALDEALRDATYCCHLASPYFTSSADPAKELIQPAIRMTESVFKAALRCTTLKRLTIMSSFAAVVDLAQNPRPGYVYTSSDWNPLTLEEGGRDGYLGYHVSKIFAEKTAWDMFKAEPKPRFALTTLCAPMIYGPPKHQVDLQKGISGLNTSLKRLLSSLTGQDPSSPGKVPTFSLPAWVDVRNVAQAHVSALSLPMTCNERFTLCGGLHYFEDGLHRLRAAGEKGLGKEGDKIDRTAWFSIDRTRAEEVLGIKFIPLETTVQDVWQWAKAAGMVAVAPGS